MRIGIPKEVKSNEFRVSVTPSGVAELVHRGHDVVVEKSAGVGSSFSDEEYIEAGATMVDTADDVWKQGDLIVKVKEPIAEEFHRMRADQVLFTYLHLAACTDCCDALLKAGTTSIAYEVVQTPDHKLPLLAPMSEVAGRLSVQIGAQYLMKHNGGNGKLLGGVSGVRPANVVVLGAGTAGSNAVAIAAGMRADVTVFDINIAALKRLDDIYQGRVHTVVSNRAEIAKALETADVVIGSVLIPGSSTPKLVTNDMVAHMQPGSVLIDIAIDQGGCFEDSHPTTYDDPTFTVHDTVFYCVANMPGAVPNTSTWALSNATLPYILQLADKGWEKAVAENPALKAGLSTHKGQIYSAPVAEARGLPLATCLLYTSPSPRD